MTDRFKFRAKRLDNNKFVYGYLCFIYIDNEKHCRIYSPDDAMSYDCYTETLGQCTGLKDMTGRPIYDGDIVNTYYNGHLTGQTYIYHWENPAFYVEPFEHGKPSGSHWYYFAVETERCRVIGNIYENPELIGGDNV